MKGKNRKMTVEERRKYYNTRINKILSTKKGLIKLAKAFCEGIKGGSNPKLKCHKNKKEEE